MEVVFDYVCLVELRTYIVCTYYFVFVFRVLVMLDYEIYLELIRSS